MGQAWEKLAEPQLPQEVIRQGISVKKVSPDLLNVIFLQSDDPRYDRVFLSRSLRDAFRRRGGLYAGLAASWLILFGLLLAMAEYGLAVQSARPQRGSVEPDGSEGPDHESREHPMNSRDSNEALGYRE